MHYETPYVNYTYPIYDTKVDHLGEIVSTGTVLDEGDVVFKDELSVKPLVSDIPLPSYAHPTDAGLDLHAISVEAPGTVIVATCIIQPGMTAKVHTGIAIKLPHGTFGAVYPRSGLATKTGLAPANMVGAHFGVGAKSLWPYITTAMNLRRSLSGIVSPSWSSNPLFTAPLPRLPNSLIQTAVVDLSEVQENSNAQVLSYELLLGFR